MSEILNIQHHRRELTLKALNKHKSAAGAAKELGKSWRTVMNYIKIYNFKKDVDGSYYSPGNQ